MSEIATKDVSEKYAMSPGKFVMEADDGVEKSEIQVPVTAKTLPVGAVVFRCTHGVCDPNGDVIPLAIEPGEHTFMLGEADADPVEALQRAVDVETKRAHLARKQLDAIAALGLPDANLAAQEATDEVVADGDKLAAGAGNDVLEDSQAKQSEE